MIQREIGGVKRCVGGVFLCIEKWRGRRSCAQGASELRSRLWVDRRGETAVSAKGSQGGWLGHGEHQRVKEKGTCPSCAMRRGRGGGNGLCAIGMTSCITERRRGMEEHNGRTCAQERGRLCRDSLLHNEGESGGAGAAPPCGGVEPGKACVCGMKGGEGVA